jgi:CheY-like chemotaxis protein
MLRSDTQVDVFKFYGSQLMTSLSASGATMAQRPKAIICLCHDTDMLQIRRMLLEHFGFIVLPTNSVEGAKTIAKQQCPDMLLMDNADAKFDYMQLAQQIKEICPELITVMLSPYYSMSATGAAASIDRFVAKDDGPDALITQINELFQGADESEPTPV